MTTATKLDCYAPSGRYIRSVLYIEHYYDHPVILLERNNYSKFKHGVSCNRPAETRFNYLKSLKGTRKSNVFIPEEAIAKLLGSHYNLRKLPKDLEFLLKEK